jgi:hypothetical protein
LAKDRGGKRNVWFRLTLKRAALETDKLCILSISG